MEATSPVQRGGREEREAMPTGVAASGGSGSRQQQPATELCPAISARQACLSAGAGGRGAAACQPTACLGALLGHPRQPHLAALGLLPSNDLRRHWMQQEGSGFWGGGGARHAGYAEHGTTCQAWPMPGMQQRAGWPGYTHAPAAAPTAPRPGCSTQGGEGSRDGSALLEADRHAACRPCPAVPCVHPAAACHT